MVGEGGGTGTIFLTCSLSVKEQGVSDGPVQCRDQDHPFLCVEDCSRGRSLAARATTAGGAVSGRSGRSGEGAVWADVGGVGRTEAPRDPKRGFVGRQPKGDNRAPPVMAGRRRRADIAAGLMGQWLEGGRAAMGGRKRVGVVESGGGWADLVRKNGAVCSLTGWGAHHPKIGFVQT